MTQDLINKLINHYNMVIIVLQSPDYPDIFKFQDTLKKFNVSKGICHCANRVFNIFVYHDKWINGLSCNEWGHWCKCPSSAHDIDEAIGLLEERIRIMKTFKDPLADPDKEVCTIDR